MDALVMDTFQKYYDEVCRIIAEIGDHIRPKLDAVRREHLQQTSPSIAAMHILHSGKELYNAGDDLFDHLYD